MPPSNDLAILLKANIDLQNGNYHTSIKELERFINERNNSPFVASAYLFSGYIQLEAGNYELAEQNFKQAYQTANSEIHYRSDKTHFEDVSHIASYWLAISLCQQAKYNEAIPYFDSTYKTYPDKQYAAQSVYALGSIADMDKNYEQAIEYYNYIQNNYKYSNVVVPSLIRNANDDLLLRNPQSALLNLQKSENIQQRILVKDTIGILYSMQDFNERYNENLLYLKGEAFNQAKNWEQAIMMFNELVTQSEENTKNTKKNNNIDKNYLTLLNDAYMGLGWAYLHKPDYTLSLKYFQLVIDSKDENQNTTSNIKALAYLNKVTVLKKQKKIDEAQQELSLLSVKPNFPQLAYVQLELGQIYYEKGDYDLARRTLERAEREADNPKVQIRVSCLLGASYLELRQYARAVDNYKKTESLAENANPILIPNKNWYLNESLLKQGIASVLDQHSNEAIPALLKYISSVEHNSVQGIKGKGIENGQPDESLFWLAEAYYRSDMLRNSAETYNKVITNYSTSKRREESLYGMGWSYFRLEQFAQSSVAFDKLVKEFPQSEYATEVLTRQGDGYYRIRNYAKASEYYGKAAKQGANTDEGQYSAYQLAHTLYRQNKYEQAITAALNYVKNYPKTPIAPNALYLIAWIRFQQERYPESIENFQFLIQTYPQSHLTARTYFAIADGYYNMGNYEYAMEGYKTVVEQFPSSELATEAMKSIQQALVALDRDAEAIGIADSYINSNPNSPFIEDFKYKKAEMYYTGRKYPDAISEYESFAKQYPESDKTAEALYWLGKSYAAMNDFDNASKIFLQLKNQFPKNDYAATGLLEYGLLLKSQNMLDSAHSIFKAIQTEFPTNDAAPQAGFERAILFFGVGDTLLAITQFKEVADKYAETDYGDQSRYRVAMYYRYKGLNDAAIIDFEKIAEVYDNPTISAEARYRIGELYLKMDNIEKAKESFEIIKEKFAGYEDWFSLGMLGLGDILEKQGNIDEAREIYSTIQQLRPADEFGKTAGQRLKRLK